MPEQAIIEDLYEKCIKGIIPTNDMIRLWLINLEERVRRLETSQSSRMTLPGGRTQGKPKQILE
jgi:hypothetical protein